MRSSWREVALDEVAELVPGKYIAKSDYVEDGPFFIYGSNSVMGKYSKSLIDVPHTIMAAIGAYAGAVRYSSEPSWVNNNAFGLVTNSRVEPKFLFLWLENVLDLKSVVAGTGQPYVQRPSLKASRVVLPPIEEQKRIVDLMSSVDSYIAALQQQADAARSARSAVLSDLLSAGGDDWTETTLGPLITLRTGKLDVNAGVDNGEFPFFTCSRDTYKIDVAAYAGKSVIVAGNGDLNVKYYEGEFNAYQRTYILQTADETVLNPKFLFCFMEKYVETLRNDTQGSTIQYLKKGQFIDAPIGLPSLVEQSRIVDVVSSMDGIIKSVEQAVVDAKNLRSGLLSDLLSGAHEIPESYDRLLGAA